MARSRASHASGGTSPATSASSDPQGPRGIPRPRGPKDRLRRPPPRPYRPAVKPAPTSLPTLPSRHMPPPYRPAPRGPDAPEIPPSPRGLMAASACEALPAPGTPPPEQPGPSEARTRRTGSLAVVRGGARRRLPRRTHAPAPPRGRGTSALRARPGCARASPLRPRRPAAIETRTRRRPRRSAASGRTHRSCPSCRGAALTGTWLKRGSSTPAGLRTPRRVQTGARPSNPPSRAVATHGANGEDGMQPVGACHTR